MIPPLPIDFAAIAANGAVMLGQVAAGAAGVVTLQSLIKAGFRYVEQSFVAADMSSDGVDDVGVEPVAVREADDREDAGFDYEVDGMVFIDLEADRARQEYFRQL